MRCTRFARRFRYGDCAAEFCLLDRRRGRNTWYDGACERRGTTLGRSADSSFQISDSTVSRKHALLSVDDAGTVHLRDDGSTNGTFVNGKRVTAFRPIIVDDGDRIQVGTSVVLKLARLDPTDELFQREMFERTVRDNLTGLYNRAYLVNQIGVLAERHAAHGMGLAVLMLDIDHFKRVNDRYGHLVGDGVLREVASVIREATRPEDLVARFGGEEFVVALPISVPHLAPGSRRPDSHKPCPAQNQDRGHRDPGHCEYRAGIRTARPDAQ